MIKDLNKILVEWSYRTSDGKPDVKNSAKLIVLESVLNDYGWSKEARAELLNNLIKEDDIVKNRETGNVYTVKNVNKDKHQLIKKNASKDDIEKVDKAKDGDDSEGETQSQKNNLPKDAPEIDIDKTTDTEVGAKVKPFIEKTSKTISKLVKAGKTKEAKALAQAIIDKYHITKPLYLQPDKKGLGKIKIGTKYKNFMGGKNAPANINNR